MFLLKSAFGGMERVAQRPQDCASGSTPATLVIRWELFFRIMVVFGCHVSPYTSGPQMSSKSLFQEDVTSRTVAQRTEVQMIRAAEEFRRKRTDRYDGMWYLSGIYYSM
jgi:hypothetical protein